MIPQLIDLEVRLSTFDVYCSKIYPITLCQSKFTKQEQSLFGMNVNATEGFPSWQWFLPFAAGFWGLTYLLWKVSGQVNDPVHIV